MQNYIKNPPKHLRKISKIILRVQIIADLFKKVVRIPPDDPPKLLINNTI